MMGARLRFHPLFAKVIRFARGRIPTWWKREPTTPVGSLGARIDGNASTAQNLPDLRAPHQRGIPVEGHVASSEGCSQGGRWVCEARCSSTFRASFAAWVRNLMGNPQELAAPQRVARSGVRLDFHRTTPFSDFHSLDQPARGFGPLGKALNLAAPHCVASFRVRLDFHWIASFPGIFTFTNQSVSWFKLLAETINLAAPQRFAGPGIRLDFHRIAPFPGIFTSYKSICLVVKPLGIALNLAAPQCFAGSGVRLDFHRIVPLFWNLLALTNLSCT